MTIFDWLASLPVWASVSVVSVFMLSMILFLVWLMEHLGEATVSSGDRSVRLWFKGKKGKKGPAQPPAPKSHAACPNVSQVIILNHEYERFWSWKHETEWVSILGDQKNEGERFLQAGVARVRQDFLNLIFEVQGADADFTSLSEYRIMQTIIDLTASNVRLYFERCYRENHLAAKTEAQFNAYKQTHISQIISIIDTFFLEHYPSEGHTPSREETHLMLQRAYPDIEVLCSQTFDRARYISKHYADQIRVKQEAIDAKYEAIFGSRPSATYD